MGLRLIRAATLFRSKAAKEDVAQVSQKRGYLNVAGRHVKINTNPFPIALRSPTRQRGGRIEIAAVRQSAPGPKADRLLWAIETLKWTFASTQSRGSSRTQSGRWAGVKIDLWRFWRDPDNALRGKARAVPHHRFEDRSGFRVARSMGTETCSRTISQSPPILR